MDMAKYDIIVLGGQSNAEGYGLGEVENEYVPNENILWLNDDSKPRFEKNERTGKDEFVIDYPSEFIVKIAEEPINAVGQKLGKFFFIFAKRYYEKYLIHTDRKVLIVNSAVGGTGFRDNQWGVEQERLLYKRMKDMTSYALSLHEETRIVALLWHQGECDSFENADWSVDKRYEMHKSHLTTMLNDFERVFKCKNLPMIAGKFCDEWYLKNKMPCDAVLKAIEEVFCKPSRRVVETSGLKSNNQEIKNDDDIHFCRSSTYALGEKYFDAYEKITAGKTKGYH